MRLIYTWVLGGARGERGQGGAHTPSDKSVMRSSISTSRVFSLLFSLRSLVSTWHEGCDPSLWLRGCAPLGEGLLLDLDPLLLKRSHGRCYAWRAPCPGRLWVVIAVRISRSVLCSLGCCCACCVVDSCVATQTMRRARTRLLRGEGLPGDRQSFVAGATVCRSHVSRLYHNLRQSPLRASEVNCTSNLHGKLSHLIHRSHARAAYRVGRIKKQPPALVAYSPLPTLTQYGCGHRV
jgi:hypothetical protein